MKVKRFFAQSMAEALKQVSHEMGPDAVILSNRRVDGGVEIVTALDYDENMARQRLGDRAVEATNGSRLAEMQAEQHRRLATALAYQGAEHAVRAAEQAAQVEGGVPLEDRLDLARQYRDDLRVQAVQLPSKVWHALA